MDEKTRREIRETVRHGHRTGRWDKVPHGDGPGRDFRTSDGTYVLCIRYVETHSHLRHPIAVFVLESDEWVNRAGEILQ